MLDRRSVQVKPAPASGLRRPSKSAAISADLMTIWKEYYQAKSITDALQALTASRGPARIIAGGTDLLLDLQQQRLDPLQTLVDVNSIPEMQIIEYRASTVFLGAAVPLSRVVDIPLVNYHAPALIEACSLIGGPQVRNQATLGGNVAHALPAADGSISLLAQGAQAEIASLEGNRLLPLQSVFAGPGRSTLRNGLDIILGFHIPLRISGEGAAFKRVMRPQGVALPVINLAVWLRRRADQIEDVRVVLGPAGPIPFRAVNVEAVMRGRRYDDALIIEAVDTLQSDANFRTSPHRATKDYRTHLAGVLLAEVLDIAWHRAVEETSM